MALRLENVSRTVHGEQHLDNVNISFQADSFNVLLGRTLAGKTSLMRLIAGLDKPSTGKIYMNESDVTGVPVQQRNISMVYQQFINYPSMTVFENIASPLRVSGDDKASIKNKVESIASLLHIEEFLQRLPSELSGGQQQRTAMARALVKQSDIVLFDEPLVNLDYKLREELRMELRELFKQRNTIAIYASTEPSEALALGGLTTLMHEGKIIQTGPASTVYNSPQSITAAELLSEPPINILEGELGIDQEVLLAGGVRFKMKRKNQLLEGHSSLNSRYHFGIRPHHLSLAAKANDNVALEMKVDVAEISGSETYLHLANESLRLVAQLQGVLNFHTDESVRVYFSPDDLLVFDQLGKTVLLPKRKLKSTIGHTSENIVSASDD